MTKRKKEKKKDKGGKRKIKTHLAVISLYVLITIIMTWPSISVFTTHIIEGESDGLSQVWVEWHIKESIKNVENPFTTDKLFYPLGDDLTYFAMSSASSAISAFFQLFTNLTIAHNITTYIMFILSAYGMFLLAYYFTKNIYASFIAGIIYSFNPFHMLRTTFNILAIMWIPFFVLYLFKTYKEKSYKNAVWMGIFMGVIALSGLYLFVYCIMFSLLFFLYYFITERRKWNKKMIMLMGTGVLIAFIISSPLIVPAVYGGIVEPNVRESSITNEVWFSADLTAFFIPPHQSTVFGHITKPLFYQEGYDMTAWGYITGRGGEPAVFIGYIVLLTIILGIIYRKEIMQLKEIRKLQFPFKFFLLVASTFFVLSLGPVLKILGIIKIPLKLEFLTTILGSESLPPQAIQILNNYIGIPLPQLLVHFIPFFNVARSPARYTIMLMLALGLLVAVCITYLLKSRKIRKNAAIAITALITIILLFEYAVIPKESMQPQVHPFYEYIAEQEEKFGILEIPQTFRTKNTLMYYQTVHQKPLVENRVGRSKSRSKEFVNNNPLLHLLLRDIEQEIPSKEKLHEATQELKNANIRYIILHKDFSKVLLTPFNDKVFYEKIPPLLEELFETEYSDEKIIVFRVAE